MTSIYINYPNPHFAAIHGATAAERSHHHKPNQRLVRITTETFSTAIAPFINQQVPFGATAATNDMWLEIDFNDHEFELSIGRYIQRLLGQRYAPLENALWH